MDDIMTPAHPLWKKFIETLEGLDGCDIHNDGTVGHCKHGSDKTHTRHILKVMGFSPDQVERSCAFFDEYHGYCDCAIAVAVAECHEEMVRERKRIERLEQKIKNRSFIKHKCYD